jgi:tetratricopeptide (TPR) repeat protein
MPGHIYIRVGRYADAAEANVKAIAADEDYIFQCRAQGIYPAAYYPHNIDFLNAALVMQGRSQAAVDTARKVAGHQHGEIPESLAGFSHLLRALPVVTMVRFGRWNDILHEPEPAADQLFERVAWRFARGMALCSLDKPREAASELEALEKAANDPALKNIKILELNSLGTIAQIALEMLKGEVAEKSGDFGKAIEHYTEAASIEDDLLYSEPPDWPIPPRH